MFEVAVIEEAAAAASALDPIRSRLLSLLAEPHSATSLAARLGLPRQKVNYHLRTLEAHGLVRLVEQRHKGNVVERVLQASAASFVISPAALATVAPDPDTSPQRLSARWLLALAARLVKETGQLINSAARAGKPLTTLGIDATVRFASAADRAAFAEELTASVTQLVSRYHDQTAPNGRSHRLVVALHPHIQQTTHITASTQP